MTIQERLTAQLQKPENQICADCKAQQPSYFKCQEGIFLCQNCSAIHRNVFSTYTSRIIPTNSHNFTETDIILMERFGNKISNEYFEHSLKPEDRPNLNNADNIRQFIIDKYKNKIWANPFENPPSSFKRALFGRKTFLARFIDFLNIINFLVIFISLVVLLLCIKYNKVLIATTFSFLIATEVYEAQLQTKSIGKLGIDLLIEIL